MKKIRIVCLANSFKLQGRCLAGILLDHNNIPVEPNMWFRPISNKEHGEIDTAIVNNIKLLDIIEIEVSDFIDKNNYQSENVYFTDNSIRKIGVLDKRYLDNMIETDFLIFGNRGKAIFKDSICFLKKSLIFIKITAGTYNIILKKYEKKNYPQIRIVFIYGGNEYNFPITDPIFLNNYQQNIVFNNSNTIYLSLSVGMEYKSWYTKLVAGVIY